MTDKSNTSEPMTLTLKELGIEITFHQRDRIVARDLTQLSQALAKAAEQAVVAVKTPKPYQEPTEKANGAQNAGKSPKMKPVPKES